MRRWFFGICLGAALLGLGARLAPADSKPDSFEVDLPSGDLSSGDLPSGDPPMLSAAPDDQGVYTLPEPPTAETGTNLGGVHTDLSVIYFNHYVYRGVDHSIGANSNILKTKASTLNLSLNGKLDFDFGKFPHPFVGIFSNVYDADPISRFQEFRPYYGLDWVIKPLILEGGGNTYIYSDRENLNTAEVYGKVTLDDSFLFHTDQPFLSPYIEADYDYDKNNGWYFESGVSHELDVEDLGLTLTFHADMAYIIGYQQQFVFINSLHDTGFQHYDLGFKAAYSLNKLLNLSDRFGQFDVLGYLTYTGRLNRDLTSNYTLWGGTGIEFKY